MSKSIPKSAKIILLNLLILLPLLYLLAPQKQLARARNFAREYGLAKIRSALMVYRAPDHEGHLPQSIAAQCPEMQVIGSINVDLEYELRNYFFKNFPYDPLSGTKENTGYKICLNGEKIFLEADKAELGKKIVLGE